MGGCRPVRRLVSATVVGACALLPDGARLAAWALVVVGWLAGITVLHWRSGATRDTSTNVSESMIERFDLFTIIVLGEVVVGVVNGIADAGRTPIAVVWARRTPSNYPHAPALAAVLNGT